jgi:hypothetical protein
MAVAITTAMQNQIAQNYIAILGRNPDPAGFAFWVQTYADANGTAAALTSITNGFGNSAEFKATYASDTTSVAVGKLYQNVLLRAADAGGLAYWTNYADNLIKSGQTISNAYAQTGAQMIYNASSQGSSDAAGINARTATAVAAGTAAPTTAYTLTTAINDISGRDITVNGLVDFNAGQTPVGTATTYQTADTITGTGGTNILNLTLQNAAVGAITALTAPAVSGMGTVNIRNVSGQAFFATGGGAYDVAGFGTGVTSINMTTSTSNVFLRGIANTTAVGYVGNGLVTTLDLEATYATSATTPVLNISGGAKGGAITVVAAGATTSTINSTGAANTIGNLVFSNTAATNSKVVINATTNLTTGTVATAADTITVNGAATLVTLGAITAANLKTINAGGMTAGGVSVALIASVTAFTGGAGADTVTTVAGTSATSAINGGGGSADVLNINDTTSISTAALAGRFTNFEILRNTAGGATASVANVAGITAIQLGGNGQGATGMTAAQALNVTNRIDNATQTLALTTDTGTSDVLTVTLLNSTDVATSADLTAATVNGFETMNVISSSGGAGDINALAFAAANKLTALNLSGAMPISVTTTNITTVGGTAINASGVTFAGTSTTAAFTITGNLVKGSVVTGSETVDAITTSATVAGAAGEFVTYNAGGGNDAITSTVAAINNTAAGSASLKIDGGAGTDTLTLNEGADTTVVDAMFQYITGVETVVLAGTSDAIVITTGGFFNTNFAGNTTTTLTLGEANNNDVNTINAATFTGAMTLTLNAAAATTQAQTVTTGSGADTITITATAYTGAANGILVNSGGGNDKITIAATAMTAVSNAVNITGGLGADTITVANSTGAAHASNYVTFVTSVGESTVAAFDNITGYFNGDTRRSDIIEFTGNATVQGNAAGVAITGYTAGELTYTINNGVMTFAGTSAAALTVAQKAAVAVASITTDLASIVFTHTNANATVDSYVFNNNALGDSLVQLIGVTATTLTSTAATAGAGSVIIA